VKIKSEELTIEAKLPENLSREKTDDNNKCA
jgi:hypothetical protein